MRTLNARLLPLSRKYYGSEIELSISGKFVGTVTVWLDADDDVRTGLNAMSRRELSSCHYSSIDEAFEDGYPCDCHYETKLGYQVATAITKALSGLELSTQDGGAFL